MPRVLLFAVCLLLAASALAERADVALTVSLGDAIPFREDVPFRVTLENRGPDRAINVRLSRDSSGLPTGPCREFIRIDEMPAGSSRTFDCAMRVDEVWPTFLVNVAYSVDSDTPDPDRSNNRFDKYLKVLTTPDLVVRTRLSDPVMPGLLTPLTVEYFNRAHTPAVDTILTFDVATGFGALPSTCTVEGTRAHCAVGTVPGDSEDHPQRLTIDVIAPDASNASLAYDVAIRSRDEDFAPETNRRAGYINTYRTYFVTNTGDSGSGSFRAAIESANASCLGQYERLCAIAFRIPVRTPAWHTIRLASPLPAIVARHLRIDATTQSSYRGDMNPLGPEIELNGSALAEGDGLRLMTRCGDVRVRGLAINGFPGNGIALERSNSCDPFVVGQISENYIGCDPAGRRAVPNERGIHVGETHWLIRDNVISGNRRSGIFVSNGAVAIVGNTIGLTATRTAPLGNGASGIYLGADGASVYDNHIGFNRDFGIAIAPHLNVLFIGPNSVEANDQLAIDHGLDGVSPNSPVKPPTIVSATYEDGATRIEIRADKPTPNAGVQVFLYANDTPDPSGFGEGQHILGEVLASRSPFTFVVPADLRGKWITATVSVVEMSLQGNLLLRMSSEFSRAVEVR